MGGMVIGNAMTAAGVALNRVSPNKLPTPRVAGPAPLYPKCHRRREDRPDQHPGQRRRHRHRVLHLELRRPSTGHDHRPVRPSHVPHLRDIHRVRDRDGRRREPNHAPVHDQPVIGADNTGGGGGWNTGGGPGPSSARPRLTVDEADSYPPAMIRQRTHRTVRQEASRAPESTRGRFTAHSPPCDHYARYVATSPWVAAPTDQRVW